MESVLSRYISKIKFIGRLSKLDQSKITFWQEFINLSISNQIHMLSKIIEGFMSYKSLNGRH